MKLYGTSNNKSFNTLKLRVALAEAGASYELVPVDLDKGDQKHPDFLRINPHGKVPVLVDGDFVLPESDAILWYIGEKYPEAKLLAAPEPGEAARQARARVLQWCDFASTTLYYAYSQFWNYALGAEKDRHPELAEAALGKIARGVAVMESVLATRPFLAGPAYSLADLSNASIVFALKRRLPKDPLADAPAVRDWYARVTAREAWKRSIAP
jgi:glutathione S-transferase